MLDAEALKRNFDGILHYGDFAYDLHNDEGERGDHFLRSIQPIAANYAYMTIPGNHEDHRNATHYKARFNMPLNYANEGTSTFYSFDMGPAHFIMFNTEPMVLHKHEEIQTELNWLKQDLEKANANRAIRPWIIAASHHPMYCSVNYRKHKDHTL